MIEVDPVAETVVAAAIVDRDGRLVSADPSIAGLNERAGGTLGGTVAVPQLATVARLARRLGIVVSRGVVVADRDGAIDLWVRAQPDHDGVRLAVTGWQQPYRTIAPDLADHGAPADALRWETDASLRLTHLAGGDGPDMTAALGKPLTILLSFDETADGSLPILEAIARRRAFVDQPARIRATGQSVIVSAGLRRGADIGFAGFTGVACPVADDDVRSTSLTPLFTSGLDKALRVPLSRIIADADSINAAADGPVQQDYVDYAADIANAGRHLLDLIDDLVDLQAIESAEFSLRAEPIDLADVARRAAGLLAVRASQGDVVIARPVADQVVPAAGDFRRAVQIMVNLIGNAVRYAAPGSIVTVTVASGATEVTAIVDDQGKGIAPEDHARIFDKFERVDPSEPGGSGLGLYIARRLARAMGGDLTVESAAGEGARFVLTLPKAPGREDQHEAEHR